jgi:serine/threonine protein kinase
MAPEVLLNVGHGKGVDWWTLGILLYEMLVGEPPFFDENPMGIYQQILSSHSCLQFPDTYNKNAKSLTKRLLTADVLKRCGCSSNGLEDVKKHAFFRELDWGKLVIKELDPPIKPKLKGREDTSNYDEYPDSIEDKSIPDFGKADPFAEF